jgi:dTDP-4-dehydrorhamnose 3,5-epimerase
VAVDLRKTSENYGRWVGVELSADNKKQLWIPQGLLMDFMFGG